jgi:UDP-N-acetylglucosamine transferase subunit ALG13
MILVTVGTHEQSFDRLIKKVDDLVGQKKIRDKVIGLIGYSKYGPKNFKYIRFLDYEKTEKLFGSADIIITHAGIGSLLLALRKGKKIIAVPRLKKFHEHSDNHQTQIVRELENQRMIIAVYDIENLEEAIRKSRNFAFRRISEKNIIVNKISETLTKWEYGQFIKNK